MMRAAMRSSMLPVFCKTTSRSVVLTRSFAALGQKPKIEDSTLEGRYATSFVYGFV